MNEEGEVSAADNMVKVPEKDHPKPNSKLANPREEVKGTLFESEVLDWRKQQRTHVREQNKKDELLKG